MVIAHENLLAALLWCVVGIDGGIAADILRREKLQDLCGISGIGKRVVEFLPLLDLKILDGPFQSPALLSVFVGVGEYFLDVPVKKRKRERPAPCQVAMIQMPADISLQFCEIAGAPGAENGRVPAPPQKIGKNMGKGPFAGEVIFRHMDHAARHVVKPAVKNRTDRFMKGTDVPEGRI